MRFTVVKELCHIAIDEPEDWSPRGHETIESLLLEDQMDQENGNNEANKKARQLAATTAQSERLAVIAATELVYPHKFRENAKEIASRTTTLRKIALNYHVPEYVIGSAIHPGRMKLARLGWELANAVDVVCQEA